MINDCIGDCCDYLHSRKRYMAKGVGFALMTFKISLACKVGYGEHLFTLKEDRSYRTSW